MNRTLITAIVLLCLSACGTIATPVPPGGTPPAEVKTFVDESAGFAFDYPADWNATGSPNAESTVYGFTLQSFVADPDSGYEGVFPPGETHLDVSVHPSLADVDRVEKSFTEDIANYIQETWQLSNTIHANWLHGTVPAKGEYPEQVIEKLFTVINGKAITMACLGDITPCKAIMRSLRPLA